MFVFRKSLYEKDIDMCNGEPTKADWVNKCDGLYALPNQQTGVLEVTAFYPNNTFQIYGVFEIWCEDLTRPEIPPHKPKKEEVKTHKKIHSISYPDSYDFDEEVNDLLKKGWDILSTNVFYSKKEYATIWTAVLVKEVTINDTNETNL